MNKLLQSLYLLCAISCLAQAETKPLYVPPLASEAKVVPDQFPEQIKAEKNQAERVRYAVMIGNREFDDLEKEANQIINDYQTKKISADDWINQFLLMVPTMSGKASIPDITAWIQAKPNSYAARYVLGRQYLEIAMNARGGKWAKDTSREEFAEMKKYAQLAQATLLKSLPMHPKPLPSYRTLMATDNFIQKPTDTRPVLVQLITQYFFDEPESNIQLDYLNKVIQADPNVTEAYLIYFTYNSPRWGGTYEELDSVVAQAKQRGLMSQKNLKKLEAELLAVRAADAYTLGTDPTHAAKLYTQAFDVSPQPEHINWLYTASDLATRAHNIDLAITIYNKIISTRAGEYAAYFERGVLFRSEKKDPKRDFADQIVAAKLGYMYAQNNVGYFYLTGDNGFPVNLEQAKAWLTLAANQGLQHAKDKLPLVEAKLAAKAKKGQ